MSTRVNPLSAASYTNKDFQSIYVELLEAAKNLAKNWDPTISNESDPGVVLLKLNAIIADKNNYNIDKNVLENYPETYTQDISARSQYKQLGYKMPWYNAATSDITFKWVGEELADGDRMSLPKYTMVMDKDGKYVFTILQPAILGKVGNEVFESCSVPAIQGTLTTLSLAGNDTITLLNLDNKNRLYINDHNIAQNGIYVTSKEDPNGVCWKQVDNVDLESFGEKCYEFDIDPRRNCPYLQFPEDMKSLIGEGIIVKYIVTDGYSGNVAAKVINTFFDQKEIEITHANFEKDKINTTSDNFLIYNINGTTNGYDPETVENAAKSFKHKAVTFDTLVTLIDYINAIYTFGKETNILSNVIVTDRTNDIQSTYRIIDKDEGLLGYIDYEVGNDIYKFSPDQIREGINIKEAETVHEADMDAYDLKLYVLKSGGLLYDVDAFNSSFEIDNSDTTKQSIITKIKDSKAISHDFVDIKPNVPFMLQNVYPIKIKFVPTHKLNTVAQSELFSNIRNALIKTLNSRMCEFGEEPSYDVIYNEILNCDERIKVLILDDFKYTTFAVYLGYDQVDENGVEYGNNPEFKYIPISDYSTCSRLIVRNSATCSTCGTTYDLTSNPTKDDIKAALQQAANNIIGKNVNNDSEPTKEQINSYRFIDSTNGIMYCWKESTDPAVDKSILHTYSERLLDIRAEVIAKNILAGVTPLFDTDDGNFKETLDMKKDETLSGKYDHISTNLEIAPFGFGSRYEDNNRSAEYKLKENESLRFTAPSFITDRTYGNYVKFELVLKNPIQSNSPYEWADPDEEESLINQYGRNSFYKQLSDGSFAPVSGSNYVSLTDVPNFKLLYHAYVDRGSGRDIEPITNRNCMKDYNFNDVKYYTPEFETNMYYHLGEDGQGETVYNLTTSFPTKSFDEPNEDLRDKSPFYQNLLMGKYFRLKHYIKGLVNVYDGENFKSGNYYTLDVSHDNNLIPYGPLDEFEFDYLRNSNNYKIFVKHKNIVTTVDDQQIDVDTGTYSITQLDLTKYTLNDLIKSVQENKDDIIGYFKVTREIGRKDYIVVKEHITVDNEIYAPISEKELEFIKFVDMHSYDTPMIYKYGNICAVDSGSALYYIDAINGKPNETDKKKYNRRFEIAKQYLSNVYIKLTADNKTLGYKAIEFNTEDNIIDIKTNTINEDKFKAYIVKCYNQAIEDITGTSAEVHKFDHIKDFVVICTEPSNWSDKFNESYKLRALNGTPTSSGTIESSVVIADISAPPDYFNVNCYKREKLTDELAPSVLYSKVDPYNQPDDWVTNFSDYYKNIGYTGLYENTPEYSEWKRGKLELYVRRNSYKLEAQTEYQLRDGDYIIFFWRDSDDDSAPYQYRKYEYVFDNTTGDKTIIKPSFIINASTIGSRKFNHDMHCNNPSGTIPYDKATGSPFNIINTQMNDEFTLSGNRQIEIRKMNSVLVSNDLNCANKYYYFISNDKISEKGQNLFEMNFDLKSNKDGKAKYQRILQPGEYFAYLNNDQTLFEILGEETLIEYVVVVPDGTSPKESITLQVNAIDTNELMYKGVDLLKDCCKKVSISESFRIIEQQIYSFVKDDMIEFTLKDSVGHEYEEASEGDYYLNYEVERVYPNRIGDHYIIPKFNPNEYYQENPESTASSFNSKYTLLETKPENWDDIDYWNTDALIYRLIRAEYELVDSGKEYPVRYRRTVPEYIKFNTHQPKFIKDYHIAYSASSQNNNENNSLDVVYSTLPNIDVENPDYGWQVTAHLNVMTDFDNPQRIEVYSESNQSKQSITLGNKKFPEKFFDELTDAEKPNSNVPFKDSDSFIWECLDTGEGRYRPLEKNKDELYLLTSIPLNLVGSKYIDTTYMSLTGQRQNIDILAYQYAGIDSDTDSNINWKSTDIGLILNINKDCFSEGDSELNLTLNNYAYTESESSNGISILPIVVPDGITVSLSGYSSADDTTSEDCNCMCCGINNLSTGRHFIQLPKDKDMLNILITITNEETENPDFNIVFENIFKCKYRDIFGIKKNDGKYEIHPKYGVTTEILLDKIKELDIDHHFKYNHIPDNDCLIDDPLNPIDVFNINHVYNKFSIAKAEINDSKPYDASFDIVNNN